VASTSAAVVSGLGLVIGGAAAYIHYSTLKGDLWKMEEDQARRRMGIKELTAKAAELQVTLQKLSSDKSSIVSTPPTPTK
jgi:hypothetical protein